MIGFRGHPLHPVLAIAPLGLLAAGVVTLVSGLVTSDYVEAAKTAQWCFVASLLTAAIVAVPGVVDMLGYQRAARGVPLRHGLLNGLGFLLVLAGWWFLWAADEHLDEGMVRYSLVFSSIGLLVVFRAWLIAKRLTR